MVKRTGPTNDELKGLIRDLTKSKIPLWVRVAKDLSKPSRIRREVNLAQISRVTKKGEVIIVPGKVLSNGSLNHSLTIVAWNFSEGALGKIKEAKATALSIRELFDKKGKGWIIG